MIKHPIGIFISGRGSNLNSIVNACKKQEKMRKRQPTDEICPEIWAEFCDFPPIAFKLF